MSVNIEAVFKTIKAEPDKAVIQFEVHPQAEGFLDLFRLMRQAVYISVEPQQPELPLDYAHCEPEPEKPANVDAETGEVYEEIADGSRMLGSGYAA